MNATRKKEVKAVISRIEKLKEEIASIVEAIEQLEAEEHMDFDDMSEAMQESDRGQAVQDAAARLNDAVSELGNVDLDYITSYLEESMS